MKVPKKSPRIAIYVNKFPKDSETFIVLKVLGLLNSGFDLQIFSQLDCDQWDEFDILRDRDDVRNRVHIGLPLRPKIKVFSVGMIRLLNIALRYPVDFVRFIHHCWHNRSTNPLGLLQSIYARAHFVGHQFDLLHIEFDFQAGSIIDLKSYFNCKVLLSSRGAIQRTNLLHNHKDILVHVFQYVDAYHFISQYLRQNLLELGLPEQIPFQIIEPAIDLNLFKHSTQSHTRSDELMLLSSGRLSWAKGYEFALDAVAMVRDAGIPLRYVILGRGEYIEPIQYAVEQHDLTDFVEFIGNIPQTEVVDYLERCDIFIHAALEEGFCNAVIEAQAMGVPVVTSDAGGLPENVEDRVTGFIVPRRNAKAMAEKIIMLAHDPELREKMSEAGRMRVAERFEIRVQIERFSQLYNETCEGD